MYDRSEDGDFRVTDPARIAELYNRKRLFYTEGTLYEYLRFEDLRADLFPRVRRLMANRNPDHPWLALDDRQMLAKAGLYKRDFQTGKEGYTLAAALLFGQDEVIAQIVPHHRIDALVRRQDLDRYDDRLDVRTNLIEAYVLLMEFIGKHLPDSFYLEGTTRVSLRDKIFREVVANILVHREYTNARPTTLVIYSDRVEAENANVPHHSPGPMQLDNFSPYPKNPSIAKFFLQLGRVDELGSGILNITKYLPRYVRGAAPRFVDGNVFQTVLPLAVYPLGEVADLWLSYLDLSVSESDRQMTRQLAVGQDLRTLLDNPERLAYELGTSWVQKGNRLNLEKHTSDDEIPAFTNWQGLSLAQKGNKLLSIRLRNMVATLLVCLEPRPLIEVMQLLDFTSRSRFKTGYTDALIQRGLLALTLPAIPSSPNQRYQTTIRGRNFLSGG
ncbi:AAA family ATPase [Hymenobacter sp. RP-2-7]|uniref:AAA family ATPase n=1 Tax=Hymenobacter polaris TaxID=2682546 RepID=A0A7Y0FNM4_9BACT|nr:AAA family ATPase [Hymenobacter polaris]NML67063.1 AAA family ATPase [Hymenobacter polaris]